MKRKDSKKSLKKAELSRTRKRERTNAVPKIRFAVIGLGHKHLEPVKFAHIEFDGESSVIKK